MKVLTEKIMSVEDRSHANIAMTDLKLLVKNIIGSSLILAISLLSIITLLLPALTDLFRNVHHSTDISEPAFLLAGVFLVGFLIAVPGTWFVQSIIDYRNARALNRMGVMTRGTVMDKWEDEFNGKSVYLVRYKYLTHLNAIQSVDKDVFQQLNRDESIFVLHLKNPPYISRLDLD